MKPAAFLISATLVIAACGGKTRTTTSENGGGGGGGAVELWASVMKPGAVFSFNDRMEGVPQEEFTTVEATVKEVKDVEGGQVAVIAWTINDEPAVTSNLPGAIYVTADSVRFAADLETDPGEFKWPASTAVVDEDHGDDSVYIHTGELAGEKCYGMGPGKDSGDCEDVCFFEICVHPTNGLMGGAGTWWPDFGEFKRRDLRK